jgi:O-antigen ligase
MSSAADFCLRHKSAIVGSVFFLASFIVLIAPLATVPALVVLSIAVIGISLLQGQNAKEFFRFDPALGLFALLALYLLANATWSLDPGSALGKVAWFALVVLLAFAASRAVSSFDEGQSRVAARAFLAGLSAGLAFILIELVTDRAITRFLYNVFPFTRAGPKNLVMVEGKVVGISDFELNRNLGVLLLLLWPGLLCMWRLRARLKQTFLFLGVTAAVLLSPHETSKIAVAASAVTFLAVLAAPTLARRATILAWSLAFVLAVPLGLLAYQSALHQAEWLPYSARARIVLWGYTAEKIQEAPLLGIGLGSSHKLRARLKDNPGSEVRSGTVQLDESAIWERAPHAHNGFLQVWYELGAVGAAMLLAAGLGVLWSIAQLRSEAQPYILAQFMAYLVFAALGWGIWQSWLMALTGLLPIYAAMAARLAAFPVKGEQALGYARGTKQAATAAKPPA